MIGDAQLHAAVTAVIERVGPDTTRPDTTTSDTTIDTGVWAALTDAGFTGVGIDEDLGGTGGEFTDALTVVSAAAASGALTPLIEHTVLAAWLAARSGLDLGGRTATLALGGESTTVRSTDEGWALDGLLPGVVHACDADVLVVHVASSVALVSRTAPGLTLYHGADLLGASVDDVALDAVVVERLTDSPVDSAELRLRGALAYAVAMSACADTIVETTVRHASQRTQFGRPLSKFQAIQQRLASMAALTAQARAAVEHAVEMAGNPDHAGTTAAAKIVVASTAREVAAAAHQIHGAIGFTSEHHLGRFTMALLAWRDRHGDEKYWSRALAERALDDGIDPWELVVDADHAPPSATPGAANL
ncbi:acyl-CoA dehydrogenase family protein [Gordonia polyisoprenivorans]|uniref:acyl-CoA dehydrogenase family protein n=1 Tax=Gordonia polyisoprenivorans TaxID=84595 RepID=UPI001AD65B35|nr:acyl-CoA dehydrogenase family protein [Gordonia polyisoprenivorans]QTI68618.1 acyl-CoA/acyl-ACP dehydrogenase [Gordonia polyisoprenivorans]